MNSLDVLENKISSIQEYLTILKEYEGRSVKEISEDVTLRGAIERYLYLAVQATIDLAEAFIAYQNFRKPTRYSETFEILKEKKVIKADLVRRLVKMVGFRNIISHDYARVDLHIMVDILENQLKDIVEFVRFRNLL